MSKEFTFLKKITVNYSIHNNGYEEFISFYEMIYI